SLSGVSASSGGAWRISPGIWPCTGNALECNPRTRTQRADDDGRKRKHPGTQGGPGPDGCLADRLGLPTSVTPRPKIHFGQCALGPENAGAYWVPPSFVHHVLT